MKLTIHKANEKLVVALPEETVARLGWGSGDVLEAQLADPGADHRLSMVMNAAKRAREQVDGWAREQRS